MNRFVYTLTTIAFLVIAIITAYMVVEKNHSGSKAPVVAEVQEQEETTEVAVEEEPVQEEVVEEEPAVEEPVEEESVEEETVQEPEEEVEYYTYKVVGASWLHLRAKPEMDNEPVATVPRGYTGYVVKMTGHWTLICADGYIGYCSDTYLELEQIDESEFPDELKGYDENDAGTTIAEGKIGPVEEANAKNVKWR